MSDTYRTLDQLLSDFATTGNKSITASRLRNFVLSTYRQVLHTTAQVDKTANTTLAALSELAITLEAGGIYKFKVQLFLVTSTTGGSKCGLTGTATATSFNGVFKTFDLDNNAIGNALLITSLATTAETTQAQNQEHTIEGIIVVNAGGTFGPSFAQSVANGTSSVKIGSNMEIQRIG